MLVEVTSWAGDLSNQDVSVRFEDRMILVRAADEGEAQAKGMTFATKYEQTVPWVVRKIVDVHEVPDAELVDGVEIYSAFIDSELANVLMKGGRSPVSEWKQKHPGEDLGQATVRDILNASDDLVDGEIAP